MKFYYAETLNPRKACAVARHLGLPVAYVAVDLAKGEQRRPDFLALNPNGRVAVLAEEGGRTLWESNAIMCRLAQIAGNDLWPREPDAQIEVLRWLSWDMAHFTRHGGTLYFEHIIKPFLGMKLDPAAVETATGFFRTSAAVLESHLEGRRYLLGDRLTVADFAAAVTLPYAAPAKIPLDDFPAIQRWHGRLCELEAWREPWPKR